jgi:hypothetical protein
MTVGALCVAAIELPVLAACARHGVGRQLTIAGASICGFGALTTFCLAIGAAATTTGVILALAAAPVLIATAGRAFAPRDSGDPSVLLVVASLAMGAALLLSAGALTCVAAVLTIAGAALTVASTRASRTATFRWLAAAALLSALVAWLAAADVTVVEAYSIPIGAALVVGGGALRRGERTISSWVAYGPGLAVVLGSSLVASLDRGPAMRTVLLTTAALLVIVIGAVTGLQAPIVIGAGVLLALAIDLGAPVAGVVPPWIPIGVAGIALLWFGATFERRMTTVRRAGAAFRRLV